jgi:hypothetical protein
MRLTVELEADEMAYRGRRLKDLDRFNVEQRDRGTAADLCLVRVRAEHRDVGLELVIFYEVAQLRG